MGDVSIGMVTSYDRVLNPLFLGRISVSLVDSKLEIDSDIKKRVFYGPLLLPFTEDP